MEPAKHSADTEHSGGGEDLASVIAGATHWRTQQRSAPSHPRQAFNVIRQLRRNGSSRSGWLANLRQNFLHLRDDVVLIRKRHLIPDLWMNDISGPAEVHDHRYGATARASKTTPAPMSRRDGNTITSADRNRLRTSAWLTQPQKETAFSIPRDLASCSRRFRSGPSPITVKRAKSLRKRGAAARKPRSQALRGTKPADENQLKFGAGLRTARVTGTQRATDAGLRDKKQFVAIRSKLGIGLGRGGYDRCRVTIGRPSKRQKSIQIPQAGRSIAFASRAG